MATTDEYIHFWECHTLRVVWIRGVTELNWTQDRIDVEPIGQVLIPGVAFLVIWFSATNLGFELCVGVYRCKWIQWRRLLKGGYGPVRMLLHGIYFPQLQGSQALLLQQDARPKYIITESGPRKMQPRSALLVLPNIRI